MTTNGANCPAVFIHGLYHMMGQLPAGDYLVPRPVLIPDLPGYGLNREAEPTGISVTGAADWVWRRIRAAGYQQAHIVGHSIGGAVAVSLAYRRPEVVASVINVEGNFTLKDAFWSRKLAEMSEPEVEAQLAGQRADPAAWLSQAGIEPTVERCRVAAAGFEAQAASTLQAMARSVVEITAKPDYLDQVRAILDRGTVFHLVAGERSRAGWDVPQFVLRRAAGMTIQPDAGHLMMLDDPAAFLDIIGKLIPAAA